MKLAVNLQDKQQAINKRWLDDIYALYHKDVAGFLKNQKDPFANPVGEALRKNTRGIVNCVVAPELDAEALCGHLQEIIKIRAIQDPAPSKALSFIFLLKGALRGEIERDKKIELSASDRDVLENRIEQTLLFAFDIYMKCREQLYELRVNEMKRCNAVLFKKFNKDFMDPDATIEWLKEGDKDKKPTTRC